MTFDEMLTFVRAHADADTTDAPTSSLTVYARMAYNDILARSAAWPHLEVSYTLTTVVNQSSYAISGLNVTDLEIVSAVIDQTGLSRRLVVIGQQDADILYGGSSSTASTNAVHYNVVNGNIILYPTPSSIKSYTVRGFRKPATWPNGGGSSPDLQRVFDEAICWFMLSQYFLSQEDTELASMYLNEYQQQVERWVKSETFKHERGRPNVMGGSAPYGAAFLRRVRGVLE